MLQFESEDFKGKLISSFQILHSRGQHEVFDFEDCVDPTVSDFDLNSYDDMVIGPQTEMSFWLPRTEFSQTTTYEDFIDLVQDIEKLEITNQLECWTNTRLLLRVELVDIGESAQFWKTIDSSDRMADRPYPIETTLGSKTFHCRPTKGITAFGIATALTDNYDKHFPPATYEDLFVEISCSAGVPREIMRTVAESYLFELSVSARIILAPHLAL
jgi:hypothetical protein